MQNLMLIGTAANRPNTVGSIYALRRGGEWEQPADIPPDASVQAITQDLTDAKVLYRDRPHSQWRHRQLLRREGHARI
jgi:hypothetical protein